MSSCRVEKKLPSCDVDIRFLAVIQNEYKNLCKQYLDIDIELIKPGGYSIRIVDDFGSESFASVEDIQYESFSDGVVKIAIDLDAYSATISSRLQLELSFDIARNYSKIQIYYRGENARSTVVAIHDRIMQAIATKKNNNYLYNPTSIFEFIIMMIGAVPFWFGIPLYKMGKTYFALGVIIMIIMWGYLYYGKRLMPYSRFDCPSADRKEKWADWLVKGSIGFIVFGSLLTFTRRTIFGF